jgi:hypothetical protein
LAFITTGGPMLNSRQTVDTKYGTGMVVCVSERSSNVYVRLDNRAGAIYVFDQCDVRPLNCEVSAVNDGRKKDDLSSTHRSQTSTEAAVSGGQNV